MDAIVRTERLRQEYFDLLAVDDVDLAIEPGEIYGLVGPNGAGKTTLLRMMATTLEPTRGRVLFKGVDVSKDPLPMRRHMGFMPDFFQLYNDLTVIQTLEYFARAHKTKDMIVRIHEVLEIIGLEEKATTSVKGLSRGMTQRLGLGRAILHKPDLLLLDEPASGLDPLARRILFEALEAIHREGATIIISSHILGELSGLCTSVGIMHEGRFIETGKTAEVVKRIMPTRRIRLVVLDDVARAADMVAKLDHVSAVRVEDHRVDFSYEGDDAGLAEINRLLVQAECTVARLEEKETNLHEVYFAIADREGARAE
ncbi:MAG: ABC transporter ATP-binding protein [Phycisphaerae bacterium]